MDVDGQDPSPRPLEAHECPREGGVCWSVLCRCVGVCVLCLCERVQELVWYSYLRGRDMDSGGGGRGLWREEGDRGVGEVGGRVIKRKVRGAWVRTEPSRLRSGRVGSGSVDERRTNRQKRQRTLRSLVLSECLVRVQAGRRFRRRRTGLSDRRGTGEGRDNPTTLVSHP